MSILLLHMMSVIKKGNITGFSFNEKCYDVVSDCYYKLDAFLLRAILHVQCLINFSHQTNSKTIS